MTLILSLGSNDTFEEVIGYRKAKKRTVILIFHKGFEIDF
jgi:hypothetical protein